MHQFFYCRSRKAGCIVLLIAMTLMGGWVRSRVVRDWLTITFRGEVHDVISFNGRIYWWASAINLNKRTSIERTNVLNETQINQHLLTMRFWRGWMEQNQGREWIIPYWPFVLLATMVRVALICRVVARVRLSGFPCAGRHSDAQCALVSGSLLFWKAFPAKTPGRAR